MSEAEQQFVATIQQGRYVAAAVSLAALWTAEAIVPMFVDRRHRGEELEGLLDRFDLA